MIEPGPYASIGELLGDALVQWKSELALVEMDRATETRSMSYLDVRHEAARVAHFLEGAGIGVGDRVAIVMTNQARWLIAATAIFARGAVLVPLDYKLSAPEQATLARHAGVALMITEHSLLRRFKALEVARVLVSEEPEEPRATLDGVAVDRWEDLPHEAPSLRFAARTRSDDATIVYSSGTGGSPKGCVLSHGAYLAQLDALMALFPMKPGHRYFSILPTNHAIDFMCGFVGPFACGATVVHQRTLRPEILTETMKTQRITHMALVPLLLSAFEKALDEKLETRPGWQRQALGALGELNLALTRRRADVSLSRKLLGGVHEAFGGHLEFLFCGGAFVDRARAERFYSLGLPVVIGYGLTECCTVATVNDLRPFRGDTVGRSVRGVDVRIADAGPDGVGEVQILGPTLMTRYWNDEELTQRAFTADGWLHTGDLGWLDAAGHLHLVGRGKNMIVTSGGKNVYPEDVESAFDGIAAEEFVVYASSYVWRDAALSDEMLIGVVRTKGAAPADELLDEIRKRNRRLPDYKRLGAVLPWSETFPRTASMKIKRGPLADSLRQEAKPSALIALELSVGSGRTRLEART